jgi:transmembrane sensor
MSEDLNYHRRLLELYLNNKCTPEQAEHILDYLRTDASGKLLLQQLREEFKTAMDHDHTVPSLVTDRLRDKLIAQTTPVKRIRYTLFFRSAAAIVLGLIFTGIYFLFLKNDKKAETIVQAPEIHYNNDVLPGTDKAVLTLANGEKIVLDSTAGKKLSLKGVVNSEGELNYQADAGISAAMEYHLLATPRGGQYRLVLPDGSRVVLDAASSIRYPVQFTGNERKVEITGQAYFEVVRDEAKPFIVNIDKKMDVQVLGTHFNINAYDNESAIKTTLIEGSVKLIKGKSTAIIAPGQQAQLSGNSEEIKVVDDVPVNEVTAWKEGLFRYNGADIRTIMRECTRWYDVDVQYEGNIPHEFVATIARDVPISKLLKILELTDNVHFKIEGKKITVMP